MRSPEGGSARRGPEEEGAVSRSEKGWRQLRFLRADHLQRVVNSGQCMEGRAEDFVALDDAVHGSLQERLIEVTFDADDARGARRPATSQLPEPLLLSRQLKTLNFIMPGA